MKNKSALNEKLNLVRACANFKQVLNYFYWQKYQWSVATLSWADVLSRRFIYFSMLILKRLNVSKHINITKKHLISHASETNIIKLASHTKRTTTYCTFWLHRVNKKPLRFVDAQRCDYPQLKANTTRFKVWWFKDEEGKGQNHMFSGCHHIRGWRRTIRISKRSRDKNGISPHLICEEFSFNRYKGRETEMTNVIPSKSECFHFMLQTNSRVFLRFTTCDRTCLH